MLSCFRSCHVCFKDEYIAYRNILNNQASSAKISFFDIFAVKLVSYAFSTCISSLLEITFWVRIPLILHCKGLGIRMKVILCAQKFPFSPLSVCLLKDI